MQYLYSFLVGGAFCLIAQIILDKTKLTPARILVGYVVFGVILSATGIYKPLLKFASSGATIPLIGFGNVLASGVRKAIDNDGFIGIFTGALTGASAGITTAIVASYITALFFKGKSK